MQPTELIVAAQQALGSGDVAAATEHARAAVEAGGGPAAREMLAGLLLFEDDIEGARREYELTFREWRQACEHKAAALVAATLADLHASWLGNRRAGQGWAARGHRLLEPYGRCIEQGYVDLAVIACESPDVRGLEIAAAAALDLAVEFGDSDLEVRALADSGYALVVQGRTRDGFARLDEAMAALSAGEVRNPAVAAMSFCALFSACERAGDAARAEEWTRVVARGLTEPLGNRPRALHMHCRLVLGSVLCTTGRWDEGEAALLEALGPGGSASTRIGARRRSGSPRCGSCKATPTRHVRCCCRARNGPARARCWQGSIWPPASWIRQPRSLGRRSTPRAPTCSAAPR